MNKSLKILIAITAVGLIAAYLVYELYYNKPHPDYEEKMAVYTLSAEELYHQFETNTDSANNKFTGKIIRITGKMDKVEVTDSLTIGVIALSTGLFGDQGIRCTMLPKYAEKAQTLKTPKKVRIKGLCSGYNDTDVILEHCSFK